MEDVVMECKLNDFYRGKKVLITGHTGFKGSWLLTWLIQAGADVCGFSLAPYTQPNHFDLLKFSFQNNFGNINDQEQFKEALQKFQPEIVFHLAALALVHYSFEHPVETFDTNVLGTMKVLEACRGYDSVKAIVCITSDKVYKLSDPRKSYTENDELGGADIYSASKSCAEILVASYRKTFLHRASLLLATARAGNVIGGGDWSPDRLIPDMMIAASNNQEVVIRNPDFIRPWQHVLDALSGYLVLGKKLLEGNNVHADAWNFGPMNEQEFTVRSIVEEASLYWEKIDPSYGTATKSFMESRSLLIDSAKAIERLQWAPVWKTQDALQKTIAWYREFYEAGNVITLQQLNEYISIAKQKGLAWA